jgi:hypothetical protein
LCDCHISPGLSLVSGLYSWWCPDMLSKWDALGNTKEATGGSDCQLTSQPGEMRQLNQCNDCTFRLQLFVIRSRLSGWRLQGREGGREVREVALSSIPQFGSGRHLKCLTNKNCSQLHIGAFLRFGVLSLRLWLRGPDLTTSASPRIPELEESGISFETDPDVCPRYMCFN